MPETVMEIGEGNFYSSFRCMPGKGEGEEDLALRIEGHHSLKQGSGPPFPVQIQNILERK